GLGGAVSALDLGQNADGRLELFGIGNDLGVWHMWQGAPNGGWGGWVSMGGGFLYDVKVIRNLDGRLETFAMGLNGHLFDQWQTTAGGAWSGGWSDFNGTINGQSIALGRNQNGVLAVFGYGTDNATLWYQYQTAWGTWVPMGVVQQNTLVNYAMALSVSA